MQWQGGTAMSKEMFALRFDKLVETPTKEVNPHSPSNPLISLSLSWYF